ncbi:MAG: 2-succinyl-5-enolpyruvyl-6-hydroxy-3-cyclohexene-1-carboxylic-acid synthase [Acidimicrobiales bacterium]
MTKLTASTQATFCSTLVDEWVVRAGLRHAVICPGSRSTPMALALATHELVRVHVRLDERSAAFVALGIGLESGVPAVLLTTSGTAAAEVHAAVVEAHQARVPMIVCTADRPPELQGVGAPQTIMQQGLYGAAVRAAFDAGVPDESTRAAWRSLGARVFAEATGGVAGPGPVHLNLPFRDPLDGEPGELPPGRPDGDLWHSAVGGPADGGSDSVLQLLADATRPLLVVGARCGDPELILAVAAQRGWPVLADPRSGCRQSGEPSRGTAVVGAADSLLRIPAFASSHRPDLVIRLGEAWASKVVNGWLAETAAAGAHHVLVDPFGEWRDPGHEVATIVHGDPSAVLGTILRAGVGASEGRAGGPVDPTWASSWRDAEELAQGAIAAYLARLADAASADELTEPLVARRLAAHPGVRTLVVSSSMPIRDVEWFSASCTSYPRVLANRGANGIDGVTSTTIGVATSVARLGGDGTVVGLLGDLAFLHDLTALVRPGSEGGFGTGHPCGLVVVDNGGGGIFSYLAQARTVDSERFEQLFGTPQAADVAALARAAGCSVSEVRKASELDGALDGLIESSARGESPVLVCKTDRARNVAVHDELNEAVAVAVRSQA